MPQYQMYFDTLEGEKKYQVDISDHEALEGVLRDIVGELHDKGHVMKGLSTGDLKVIWGGRDGKELDQSRTLPEQGVLPNDVLRVLVEIYEGGGGLREDRIEGEWRLLQRLAKLNPLQVQPLERRTTPLEEVFRVRLSRSPAIEALRGGKVVLRDNHTVRLSFPRFYPEVPIECHIEEPTFHPNINPVTVFVCLWEQTSRSHTVVQALARAQAMLAYRMVNLGEPHLMNREAARWYSEEAEADLLPLGWDELKVFEVRDGQLIWLEPGRGIAPRPRIV